MLALDNITLVCIDTVHSDQALYAMRRCMRVARFGRAILFGNSGTRVDHGIDLVPVDGRINSASDYSSFVVNELPDHIHSDWALIIQWDGFIINPSAWTGEFLEYDYIGAPWPDLVPSVGNGGFSLRSRRLLAAAKTLRMPNTHPEDVRIAVDHGEILSTRYGIRFAPIDLAQRFSFENTYSDKESFGFHALFNFHLALESEELQEWLKSAPAELLLSQFGQELAVRMHRSGRGCEAWPILLAALKHGNDLSGNAIWRELWQCLWRSGSFPENFLEVLVEENGARLVVLMEAERQAALARIAQAEARTAEAEAQIAQADAALQAVLVSRSWRVTEPLRRLDDTLRLLRDKAKRR
jgi:hypothetical protein